MRSAQLAFVRFMTGVVALIAVASPSRARAQDAGHPEIDLHGFGGVALGGTNTNRYLSGSRQRDVTLTQFSLNIGTRLSPRLLVSSQLSWENDGRETRTEIDYAFAEWEWSDAARIRIGRVKHPFGNYAEVFDVGTLRPFLSLPQSVYGPTGFVSESYDGLGMTGLRPLGKRWQVAYDLYVGGLTLPEDRSAETAFLVDAPLFDGPEEDHAHEVIGGRLTLNAPTDGLSVGISSYSARTTADIGAGDDGAVRKSVVGAHAGYLTDRLWLRVEHVVDTEQGGFRQHGSYVEGAYFVTRQWQLAGQLTALHMHALGPEFTESSLSRHDEAAAGWNYWFSPSFVAKVSYHIVDGNRFAHPGADALRASLADGTIPTHTRLIQIGGQFSF